MALESVVTAPELTQEQVIATLVRPLEAASVFLAAGPRIIDTAGPVRIPTVEEGADLGDSYWLGQLEQIPTYDPTFGELTLLPSTMESLKVICQFSNELARQSFISLDAAIRDRLTYKVARAMDLQLLSGTGDGITKPQGLMAWSGVQSVDLANADLDLDDLIDAQGLLLAANADPGAAKWLVRPEDFTKLRKVKLSSGEYVVQSDVTQGAGFTLLGAKVLVTPNIPKNTAALVDFSKVTVARDVAPAVSLLTERYADIDAQAVRVVYRLDAKPTLPQAIVKFTNVGTVAA